MTVYGGYYNRLCRGGGLLHVHAHLLIRGEPEQAPNTRETGSGFMRDNSGLYRHKTGKVSAVPLRQGSGP